MINYHDDLMLYHLPCSLVYSETCVLRLPQQPIKSVLMMTGIFMGGTNIIYRNLGPCACFKGALNGLSLQMP